ncbi:MAG: DNA-binding protein [Methanomassiliicoccus sp.]|nr:DNA-binding protein [Methanomassiliicoccus sp.]
MRYSEATRGRVFIIRLEQGEVVHEVLERFASEHDVRAAAVLMVGAADCGSSIVCGPKEANARPVEPLRHALPGVSEMAGVGTLFPDENDRPMLHVHAAFGRDGKASAGCVRSGVVVWQVLEVIMFELVGSNARKVRDPSTGFELLEP